MSSEASEFANFIASNAGCGGSGAGYIGPPPQNVILPAVNISQTGGGDYGPPAPAVVRVPYVAPPPAASSSSSSSSDPINAYDRYRNYTFSNKYMTDNYGDEYTPTARTGRTYNPELQSRDQYGQEYDINELNLAGFKDRLKKSKKQV
jgi:hypothetical protein